MVLYCANGKKYDLPTDVTEDYIRNLVKQDYPNPLIIKRTEDKYYVLHKE